MKLRAGLLELWLASIVSTEFTATPSSSAETCRQDYEAAIILGKPVL